MQKKIILAIVTLILGNIVQTTYAESASVLLEKGIYAEETAGDVDEAMSIYQKIIADEQANRQAAAQAYYRLGKCYQKKGDNTKAVEFFQKLIANYPEQKELIEKVKSYIPIPAEPTDGIPRVVGTTPAALANDVSPDMKEITVTFDHPMMDQSWSWTGGGETYPQRTGAFFYNSEKTICTMPVRLEAGKVYWVGINSPSHRNFKNMNRVPAMRYVILFATRGADGKPTPIPEDMLAQAKAINARSQKVESETPAEFPEIVGCRVKQTAELTLQKLDTRPAELPTKKIFQGDLLALKLKADPKLISSFKYFGVIIHPFEADPNSLNFPNVAGESSFKEELIIDQMLISARYRVIVFGTNDKITGATSNKTVEDLAELKLEVLVPSRTQIDISDIQLDGTIKWKLISHQINWSGQTITSDDSRTSDCITAEKFFDQDGKPLKVDISHEGSYYRYHVTLNQPIQPNQFAMGWMEGKMLGMIHGVPGTNDALEYKFDHAPGGNDPVRRIEIYRLPKGAEVVSTEPANMLRREVKGQIELAHVEMIPSGGSILTQFVYKLPKKATKEDKLEAERLSAQGWQLFQQQKLAEAEELFKKAVDKDPKNTKALNGLGWSQFQQGMPENAIVAFEKCLTIDPKHGAALNGLGWIFDGKGETDKAIQYWERAVNASPHATAALSGLTKTYMELKQYDKAVKYYKKWLAAEPNNAEARQGLENAQALAKTNAIDPKK